MWGGGGGGGGGGGVREDEEKVASFKYNFYMNTLRQLVECHEDTETKLCGEWRGHETMGCTQHIHTLSSTHDRPL